MHQRAEELIRRLDLAPHPEGGFFRETYRSRHTLVLPGAGLRSAVTDIYFLLVAGQASRFHRVRHDEIWHFYEGDPLELVEIDPQLAGVERTVLSGGRDLAFRHCVRGGTWQAAFSRGEYTLAGCTVAPGFDFADFEFMDRQVAGGSKLFAGQPELYDLL